MVGNKRDAEYAKHLFDHFNMNALEQFDFDLVWDEIVIINELMSKAGIDWTILGAGATRVAIQSPDNVVYKVCYSWDNGQSNIFEYENYESMAIKVNNCGNIRLAECSLYELLNTEIIAMECVEDDVINYWDKALQAILNEVTNSARIIDIHEDNIRFCYETNQFVLIDYAK